MTDTLTIVQEQFKTLPEVIQETILNSNWQEKIRRIVKANNLHVDQGASIENLVIITMLGMETPENFVKLAQDYAQVSYEQALSISSEVEREIFGDIRKKLIEATDSSGTVAEIDKATNELDKVASEIERQAKESTAVKTSLKDRIPPNYFETNKEVPAVSSTPVKATVPESVPTAVVQKPAPIEIKIEDEKLVETEKTSDPYLEPIIEEVASDIKPEVAVPAVEEKPPAPIIPKIAKPIFSPMPKNIAEISNPSAIEDPSPKTTVKIDPYREPIA